jgi:hypothetical protein
MNAKLSLPLLAAMLSVACVLSGFQSPTLCHEVFVMLLSKTK